MWIFSSIAARAGFDPVTPGVLALDGGKSCGGSFLDLEGDGDWDLVTPADDEVNGVRLLKNDGAIDAWTDITATHAPELFEPGLVRGLLPADLTNDGWTDLVRIELHTVQVLVSSGPPDFTLTRGYALGSPGPSGFEGAAILDVDDDGWLDVLVTAADVANYVLVNPADGTVAFTAVDQAPSGLITSANSDFVTVGDWDTDGDTDVVIRGEGVGPDAFVADANGWEAVSGFDLDASNEGKGAVALCDVGGTGALDLFWSKPVAPAVSHYRWDRTDQTWSSVATPAFAILGVRSLTCGDVDNDGFVDLWLADDDDDDILLGPDLTVGFGGGGSVDTIGAALADLDGDGDLDVYQVNDLAPNALLENDQNDDDWLRVRLLANVASCPASPVLRDDIGATLRVLDTSGAPVTSLVELSGGMGRGQVGWPVLHVGGVDPTVDHRVAVDFRYGGGAPVILRVAAGTHDLVLASDDPDGDGVGDAFEQEPVPDMDGDGFVARLDDDTDGDGYPDRDERGSGGPCDPPRDTDADGVADLLDTDSDDDGVDDDVDLDPLDWDVDDDDLSDGDELTWGTDPTNPDSDGGGRSDGEEVHRDLTDPTDEGDDLVDTDNDGIVDSLEPGSGTDPTNPDSDGDGLLDGDELYDHGTDPTNPDSDGDGVDDGQEIAAGSDPNVFDPPVTTPTVPPLVDSDGDGIPDGSDPDPTNAGGLAVEAPSPSYGCGCATGAAPTGGWWGLLALLLGSRYRLVQAHRSDPGGDR